MVSLRPLGDALVVRRLDPPEKIGSIILPQSSKEPPQRGIVVAAGPGERDVNGRKIPMDVRSGDHVLFGKFSGKDIELNGETLLVMREPEVLGIVRK